MTHLHVYADNITQAGEGACGQGGELTTMDDLPPLPEAEEWESLRGVLTHWYTAEQMHAYARAALAAQPQAQLKVCNVLKADDLLAFWMEDGLDLLLDVQSEVKDSVVEKP
jgi:hypothetical protein